MSSLLVCPALLLNPIIPLLHLHLVEHEPALLTRRVGLEVWAVNLS
jgi:hypothetical protein